MGFWDEAGDVAGTMFGGVADYYTGGAFSANKASQANKEAQAMQLAHAEKQMAAQKEFAQHGVRWKVADAQAAGIHPLVGLGAQTQSFSPVSIGLQADTAKADGMSRVGQNIGRAINSTQTQEQRDMATLQVQGAKLDVEGKALDNQIKNSNLRNLQATGPAFPGSTNFISGQGNSGPGIVEKSLERTRSLPGSPQSEPGAIPDMGWAKTKSGVVPIPSKDVKERIEDNMPQEWSHYFRNNIAPNWGGGTTPPASALPKGATKWEWSHGSQEFQPYFPKYKFERKWK